MYFIIVYVLLENKNCVIELVTDIDILHIVIHN